jgi:hypothetical protein
MLVTFCPLSPVVTNLVHIIDIHIIDIQKGSIIDIKKDIQNGSIIDIQKGEWDSLVWTGVRCHPSGRKYFKTKKDVRAWLRSGTDHVYS